ncbi:Outward-rectifier potassium channel TOK1 [Exophiala dermatitidis]
MNDPSLDDNIIHASNQVTENVPKSYADEEEEERSFLTPARWWYASTAFPLIAGTFGPMANAFSVCALVENWRVRIPAGGTEEHGIDIKDPSWLIAVNAVSLVCALVANLSLLLNMARRVPFQIAQPVTIVGFWLASVLLIVLIAIASTDFHAPGVQNQALTQAYYYAVFAAGLYQIISYLMCVTVYGAYKGHYSKEFRLTVAQRTLMLQTIAFLVYQLLGALVYSHVEGWKFLDAVYWADFTSLTIGVGADYVPKTDVGRGLLFPFAMGGIIILGLVVSSIRSLILDRGKKKIAARLTEKSRAKLLAKVEKIVNEKSRIKRRLMGLDKNMAKALATEPGDDKIAEIDRREAEFEAMRRVQDRATTQRKYLSLGISTFAFAFLWTLGAFIFSKAEQNQDWSYFECVYFAYTTLLTIGYGDLQPMSNSGKPFFVFWSLLAVPTLTILISDLGDTVIKTVKDVTIWLGEITVLPSDEASTRERLRQGLYKATLGKLDSRHTYAKDVEQGSNTDEAEKELHPGLAKLFGRHGRRRENQGAHETGDRLAADFERSEEEGESLAREHGERAEEDEHHYRHALLSQIRKVYADTTAATPKRYSYEEWVRFLRLLGEDEQDPAFHRRAPELDQGSEAQEVPPAHEQEATYTKEEGEGKEHKKRWSWIGNHSPLMRDKEEAEWLLEKLFARLEESLRGEGRKKEERVKKETRKNHAGEQQPPTGTKDDDTSRTKTGEDEE